ncbi:hypothetical protein D917_04634, partial [Trichinella nativa]
MERCYATYGDYVFWDTESAITHEWWQDYSRHTMQTAGACNYPTTKKSTLSVQQYRNVPLTTV